MQFKKFIGRHSLFFTVFSLILLIVIANYFALINLSANSGGRLFWIALVLLLGLSGFLRLGLVINRKETWKLAIGIYLIFCIVIACMASISYAQNKSLSAIINLYFHNLLIWLVFFGIVTVPVMLIIFFLLFIDRIRGTKGTPNGGDAALYIFRKLPLSIADKTSEKELEEILRAPNDSRFSGDEIKIIFSLYGEYKKAIGA